MPFLNIPVMLLDISIKYCCFRYFFDYMGLLNILIFSGSEREASIR